jgi:hypothetical protein
MRTFTLKQIRAATNGFSPANKVGEGGFGPVYKVLIKVKILPIFKHKKLCLSIVIKIGDFLSPACKILNNS